MSSISLRGLDELPELVALEYFITDEARSGVRKSFDLADNRLDPLRVVA
jgi:hypothetical protein